ncbi:MAG: hypothetical protein WDN08_01295 [Rhizomicrobium sp.]
MSEPVEALLFDLGGVFVEIDFARVNRVLGGACRMPGRPHSRALQP